MMGRYMKKLTLLATTLVILLAFLVLSITSQRGKIQLISPLLKQEKILGLNQWFPSLVYGAQVNAPDISARAALFIDTKSGQVLFAKNPNSKLPIASLVKVMTVLVALDHKSMEDKFLVSQKATEAEPDEMILLPGERLTLKELLYGIFLISANDAAEVLAEEATGSREEFIQIMNSKASQLGMKDTYFANPTGLDEDNNSYSTVYDLAILTRYLIRKYPEVVEITQTPHIYIPQTSEHQDYDMFTGINLVTTYPGVVGFKTGYTPEANFTLITLARQNGHEIVGVLLGSENRRDEAKHILDYSFSKL